MNKECSSPLSQPTEFFLTVHLQQVLGNCDINPEVAVISLFDNVVEVRFFMAVFIHCYDFTQSCVHVLLCYISQLK